MMRRIRPTYAGTVSTLALFVALGGGAYAAGALPAHSVGSRQLKKNAVTRTAIKSNAVNGAKVADGSLTGADIRLSALGKVPSAAAADSATNATNAVHAAAAAALDHVSYTTAGGIAPAAAPARGTATATCAVGQHAVGGGVLVADPDNAFVIDDYPDGGGTAWTARVGDGGGADVAFTVYAVCTSVTAAS
jgi:hypothetical protein